MGGDLSTIVEKFGPKGESCLQVAASQEVVQKPLPVVVLNRDTYFSTARLDHSVSQDKLPRLAIAVWPRDDV
jgi:hypothetical protein